VLAGLALATASAFAAASDKPTLAPTDAQRSTVTLVYGLISDSRYSVRPMSAEAAASPLFDAYLEELDEQHLFLEARDIEEFAPLRKSLGESIKKQDLDPAFRMFERFLQRVDERLARVPELVAATPDFSLREAIAKKPGRWLDTKELDARWRAQIKADLLELRLAGVSLEAARALVLQRYEGMSTRTHELESADVTEAFLDAYARVAHAGQGYMAPRTAEQVYRLSKIDLSLVGVGMSLRKQGVYTLVDSLVPGGPAAAYGALHQGDRLYGAFADGKWQDLVGWKLDDVVDRLRGKRGTSVKLRVRAPDAAIREVELVRDQVALKESIASSEPLDVDGKKIEVLRLPSFYLDFEASRRGDPDARSACADLRKLIEQAKLRGAKGLVLDLRGNGGGAFIQAVEVAALFIGKQPVAQVRESGGGKVLVESGESDATWTGPLTVLVDEQSAAASEIVAAAVQESGRALVVGQRTFGRGSVQNLIDLDRWPAKQGPKFGQVKLTIAELFRPGGLALEPGVVPDIVLDEPLPSDRKPAGTGGKIPPAAGLAPITALPVQKLRAAHEARARQDAAFQAWLAARAVARREALADSISLDESQRRAEAARVAPVLSASYRPEVRDAPLRVAAAVAADMIE
jgi:carboxyl-terminal processing protease